MGLSKEIIDALCSNEVCQIGSTATALKSDVAVPTEAFGPAEKPDKIEGKVKVLFLPGRQSNQNLAGFQMNQLKGVIGKESEITICDCPMVWKYVDGHDLHDADDMSISLSKGLPFGNWFDVDYSDKRKRPYMWKFFDGDVDISYKGGEKAIETVLDKVQEQEYDVVMALFEGCIALHMAIGKLMEQGKKVPWKLSVCFGSMPIRDPKFLGGLATAKCDTPCICCFGKQDQDYLYSRAGAGACKPSEEYYTNVTVLEGLYGHMMPRDGDIYQRIWEEMKWVCGMSAKKPEKIPIPPRPTSWPLLSVAGMTPKKLRVLSLCGGHSLESINKMATASLKMQLGDADWTYIAGTKAWSYYKGEPIVSEMEERIANGKQLYNWYMDYAHEESERMNSKKQFDKNVKVEYYDIEEVVDYWIKYIEETGPYDVVIGFSQGCMLLHMIIGTLRKRNVAAYDEMEGAHGLQMTAEQAQLEERKRHHHSVHNAEEMPWRVTVFFAGMHIRDPKYQHLGGGGADGTPSPHPVVFVYGTADEYYEYARDGFGTTPKTQEEYYKDPLILVGDHDHEFPNVQPRARQIYDQVIAKIWYHCGGQPEKPKVAPKAITGGGGGGKGDLKALIGPPAK